MLLFITIAFNVIACCCAYNAAHFYAHRNAINLGTAIFTGLLLLLLVAQYIVAGVG